MAGVFSEDLNRGIWQQNLKNHFSGHPFLLPWECSFFTTCYISSIVRLSSNMEDHFYRIQGALLTL